MITTIICVVVAVFAIAILYLTRSNIIDLLDRDVVMYDKNYQIKKDSLQEAFDCLDLVAQNGLEVKNNPQYILRAKEAYNALLCSLNNPKLYQEFYRLAVDSLTGGYSVEDIEKFKIACRAELIGKRKSKNEGFKGSANGVLNNGSSSVAPLAGVTQQPARPTQPTQPARPVQQARPAQRPQPRPQQPNDQE